MTCSEGSKVHGIFLLFVEINCKAIGLPLSITNSSDCSGLDEGFPFIPRASQKTSYKGTSAKPNANISGTAIISFVNVFLAPLFINLL